MFELVLVVCLLAQPEECMIERPPFVERFPNVVACTRVGYINVVQWLMDHPNWSVRRWRCEPPEA